MNKRHVSEQQFLSVAKAFAFLHNKNYIDNICLVQALEFYNLKSLPDYVQDYKKGNKLSSDRWRLPKYEPAYLDSSIDDFYGLVIQRQIFRQRNRKKLHIVFANNTVYEISRQQADALMLILENLKPDFRLKIQQLCYDSLDNILHILRSVK